MITFHLQSAVHIIGWCIGAKEGVSFVCKSADVWGIQIRLSGAIIIRVSFTRVWLHISLRRDSTTRTLLLIQLIRLSGRSVHCAAIRLDTQEMYIQFTCQSTVFIKSQNTATNAKSLPLSYFTYTQFLCLLKEIPVVCPKSLITLS